MLSFAGEPAGFVWHQVLWLAKAVLEKPGLVSNKSHAVHSKQKKETEKTFQTNSLGFEATVGVWFHT